MVGLASGIEWASWITLMTLYGDKGVYLAPILIGFLLNYVLNVANIIYIKRNVYSDPEF